MIPTTKATTPSSLLLTYENINWCLTVEGNTYTLINPSEPVPIFQVQEPLIWIQGMMTSAQTAHLTYLKSNGELCYTVVSPIGGSQTTTLDKLEVRSTRYIRPVLLIVDDKVHIFYGYSYQGIADMWVIEHRFWNGKTWRTARLGESFHPKEPLYHISVDEQKNIHFLSMTFQGRQSLMFSNRFHGVFHLWGEPVETMKFSGEVVDMTAVMTSDNVYHLFWVLKNLNGVFELRWAQRPNACDFTSTWTTAPAPIRNFQGPWKRISIIELNGCLWLLAHAKEKNLMLYEGQGWKFVGTSSSPDRPLLWTRTTSKGFQSAPWLQDQSSKYSPFFAKEIGLQIHTAQTPEIPQHQLVYQPPPTELEIQNIISHPELHYLLDHPHFKDKYLKYVQATTHPAEISPHTTVPTTQVNIPHIVVPNLEGAIPPLLTNSQDALPQLPDSLDTIPQLDDFQEDIPPLTDSLFGISVFSDPQEFIPQVEEDPVSTTPVDRTALAIQEYMTPILQTMETLIHSFEKLEQQLKSWQVSQITSTNMDNKGRRLLRRWFG